MTVRTIRAVTTPGELLNDRYRVVRAVAKGGMGAVLEGVDERLQRVVAIKIVRPELVRDATLRARFEREARAAAAINHPNVLQVFDLDVTAAGQPFLVMEWMAGESLANRLRSGGKFDPAHAASCAEQALRGLAAAHQLGIVHRDIKPGNLMVVDNGGSDLVKVVDFGIAQLKTGAEFTRLTMTGEIIGTPAYMPPEQLQGQPITPPTDVYAMGVVLWCLVVGRQPFGSGAEVIPRVLAGTWQRADAADPTVPREIADIAARAMQKDPAARFGSALEMADALAASVGRRVSRTSLSAPSPSPAFATNTFAASPPSVATVHAGRPSTPMMAPPAMTNAIAPPAIAHSQSLAPIVAPPPMIAVPASAPSRGMMPYAIGGAVALAVILAGVGGAAVHARMAGNRPANAVTAPAAMPNPSPPPPPVAPISPAADPKPPEAVPTAPAATPTTSADAGVAIATRSSCENWSGTFDDLAGPGRVSARLCTSSNSVSGTASWHTNLSYATAVAGSWNAAHTLLTLRDTRITRAESEPCMSTYHLRAEGSRRLSGIWESPHCRGITHGGMTLSR